MTANSERDWPKGASPLLERCRSCRHAWLTARGFCPRCGGQPTDTVEVDGRARVDAVTVVHRAVQPSTIGPAPYAIALTTLEAEPGIRIMALTARHTAIGDHVTIERLGDTGAPYLARATQETE